MADEEEGNNDEDQDFNHCPGLSSSTVVDEHNCLRAQLSASSCEGKSSNKSVNTLRNGAAMICPLLVCVYQRQGKGCVCS